MPISRAMQFRPVLRLAGNGRWHNSPVLATQQHSNAAPASDSANVNLGDVERHAKLAQDWWNPAGPMRALHSLNSIRVPFIRDGLIAFAPIAAPLSHTSAALRDQRLLEVGCGAGILTESLARLHAAVTAIDPGDIVIATARQHLASSGAASASLASRIDYRCETLESLCGSGQPLNYDAVIVSEVLEHVPDKAAFLRQCVAALRPGGSLFITTFNRTCASWLGAIVWAEYVTQLVPRGTHQWQQFVGPVEVQRQLTELGCRTVLVNGFVYEMWRDAWRWIPSLELSYALHAVKAGGTEPAAGS